MERNKYTSRQRLYKWLLYSALILVFFLFESVGLMPQIYGVRPSFMLLLPVCIAICEGPLPGAVCGAACGVLIDVLSGGLGGFYSVLLIIFCTAAGLLVSAVMRNNIVTALALTGGSAVIIKFLHWYLFTYFAGVDRTTHFLVNNTIPSTLYTILMIAPLYYLTLWIKSKFDIIND